jgi:putative peptidoglycan lipid II flippase
MILGLGVLQLNTAVDALIASYPTTVGPTLLGLRYPLQEGALAAVSFAQRLYQFPLGVFGLAVATAIFPALARTHGDRAAFSDLVGRGLRLVVFIGLPASAGLCLVGGDLATVILEGGAFGSADSRRVAFILMGYAAGVWAYSMIHVLTRAFYARGDTSTPVRVALGIVVLNLGLNCTLIWTPLREAGLAWSTSACAVAQAGLLLVLLRQGRLEGVAASWLRSLSVTALMVLAVGGVGSIVSEPDDWLGALTRLAACVTAGIVTVGVAAVVLRMPELWWAMGRRPASDSPPR